MWYQFYVIFVMIKIAIVGFLDWVARAFGLNFVPDTRFSAPFAFKANNFSMAFNKRQMEP